MAALRLVAALILAFAAWLWGMPWPWLRAIAMVALPICATLNLVVILPWHALGRPRPCLGNVPMVVALAFPVCPLKGFFFFQVRVSFFSFFSKRNFFSQMSSLFR